MAQIGIRIALPSDTSPTRVLNVLERALLDSDYVIILS